MLHAARRLSSWLIYDVGQMMTLGFFSRMWLLLGSVVLLMLALLCYTPIEKMPILPGFRGVGSSLLLFRRLLPEDWSRPAAAICALLSMSTLLFLYATNKAHRSDEPSYYRELRRGKKKP